MFLLYARRGGGRNRAYSHSMVLGGLELMS
jgi:hypothetical protein